MVWSGGTGPRTRLSARGTVVLVEWYCQDLRALLCSATLQRYTAALHCSATLQRYTTTLHCSVGSSMGSSMGSSGRQLTFRRASNSKA